MTKRIEIDDVNLEDMIRAAAANGEMTHLSVVPKAGKGPGNITWCASYSPASKWGSGFGEDIDPVKAVKLAMTDTRLGALVTQMRHVLEGGKAKFPTANAALKNLPPEVDDSDFV